MYSASGFGLSFKMLMKQNTMVVFTFILNLIKIFFKEVLWMGRECKTGINDIRTKRPDIAIYMENYNKHYKIIDRNKKVAKRS